MKQTHKKHGLTADVLRHLYLDLRLSDRQIGDRFGITDVAVSYYRRRYGVATLSSRDRIGLAAKDSGLRDVREIGRDEFVKLYRTNGERCLARMFGASRQLIRNLRDEYGVVAMDKTDRTIAACPEALSQEQVQVLYGSLLGDGGLSLANNGKSARFHEFHSFVQLDYIKWKQTVLHPFAKRMARSDKVLEDGRIAYGYSFNTCYHPVFLDFWAMFYGTGVKRLPADFDLMFCPMVMAVWYMDDGHLSDRNQDGVFTLASGFPQEDIDRIAGKMNGLGWDVESREGESVTVLWLNNKDRFYNYIAPHARSSLMYKMPVSLRGDVPSHRWKEHIEMFKIDFSVLGENEVEREVERFFRYWRSVGFSYPYCGKKWRQREIMAVRSSSIDLSDDLIPQGHSQGTSLCSTFFDNAWKAKRKGGKSPLQVFEDDKLLRHAIRDCIKHRKRVTDSDLRLELRTFGGVHNFRPALAKAIYDYYCPAGGSVLDPCAGWGGRLLGFMCSEAVKYVGVDVESDTVRGLRMMADRLGKEIEGNDIQIHNCPFEDWTTEERFDLVFTSPPYFDAEWYGRSPVQSSVRYPDYGTWCERFLFALIDKSLGVLRPGGRLILNVADVSGGPVGSDARNYLITRCGLERELRIVLPSRYGHAPRFEPVLVGNAKT